MTELNKKEQLKKVFRTILSEFMLLECDLDDIVNSLIKEVSIRTMLK